MSRSNALRDCLIVAIGLGAGLVAPRMAVSRPGRTVGNLRGQAERAVDRQPIP